MTEGASYILVVEDDPLLKNMMGHTFAGLFETIYANDGQEAIKLFETYKPKLILLDLTLPTMGGFEVLETLRKREDEGKTVPVIVVSNLGQQSDKDRALSLGASDYLVKAEVDVDEILKKAKAVLGLVPTPTPTASA